MRITVLFSGLFRIIAGVEQEVLDVAEGTTIDQLSDILVQKYLDLPLEKGKDYFLINDQVSTPDQIVAEGDRVRVLRLFAGG